MRLTYVYTCSATPVPFVVQVSFVLCGGESVSHSLVHVLALRHSVNIVMSVQRSMHPAGSVVNLLTMKQMQALAIPMLSMLIIVSQHLWIQILHWILITLHLHTQDVINHVGIRCLSSL